MYYWNSSYFTKLVETEPTEKIALNDITKFLINVFTQYGVHYNYNW